MRTAVFLQARLGSHRLPEKILLPLANKTVIEYAMQALGAIPCDVHALLCDEASRSVLEALAGRYSFQLFAGNSEDVLDRFVSAARTFSVDTVIRATGDNPFVSPRLAEKIWKIHQKHGADYSAYNYLPLGAAVEVVRAASLFQAEVNTVEPYDREHVCPYLYHNPEEFKIHRIAAPKQYRMPGARVTLDTEDDYRYMLSLIASRSPYKKDAILEIDELLELIRRKDDG